MANPIGDYYTNGGAPARRCPVCRSSATEGRHVSHVLPDGPLWWECVNCGFAWHRFSAEVDATLHELANMYMQMRECC